MSIFTFRNHPNRWFVCYAIYPFSNHYSFVSNLFLTFICIFSQTYFHLYSLRQYYFILIKNHEKIFISNLHLFQLVHFNSYQYTYYSEILSYNLGHFHHFIIKTIPMIQTTASVTGTVSQIPVMPPAAASR